MNYSSNGCLEGAVSSSSCFLKGIFVEAIQQFSENKVMQIKDIKKVKPVSKQVMRAHRRVSCEVRTSSTHEK
jgi:16S rRNA U1498 N3-methylase RsmE